MKDMCWAILPEAIENFEVFFGEEDLSPKSYISEISDGLATIKIIGPIGRRLTSFEKLFFGGVDSEILLNDLALLKNDYSVKGVLLVIDSPGGMVDGTLEVAEFINSFEKPVVAYTDGMMASAAYWIGSAADAVYASPTAQIGSIGVVATHVDISKKDEKAGVKRTYITSGKYKRIANATEPLSEDGKSYLQEMVDNIYDIFVSSVSKNRKIKENLIRDMEAKVFIAAQASENNLINGIASFKKTQENLRRRSGLMELSEFKESYKTLYEEVLELGKKSIDADYVRENFQEIEHNAKKEAVDAERTRILEIMESAFPGQESLVLDAVKSGIKIDDARKAFIADEKNRKNRELESIEASDPGDIGSNHDTTNTISAKHPQDAGDKLNEIAKQLQAESGKTYAESFEDAIKKHPELFKIYNNNK